jgi:hypothetical protein
MRAERMGVVMMAEDDGATPWRDRFLLLGSLAAGLLLFAAMAFRALRETGSTNAYALIAESLLTLTPNASTCFGSDCASFAGKTYIVFPPFPALFAMPLVWLNGTGTAGFGALSIALWAGSLLVWDRLFRHLAVEAASRLWLLLAIGFASPLFYVTIRADGVWFFAQSVAFFFVTLALHEALIRRSLATAGLALGAALLSRQFSVFYAPLLLLLWMRPHEPVFAITRERVVAAAKLAIPILAALACYFAYNYWRFGDPLETGYHYITFEGRGGDSTLRSRVDQHGLWSGAYVVYNLFYFFFQGFHAEFASPQKIALTGLDPGGSSFLAASPWLLLAFFAKRDLRTFLAAAMMVGFTAMLLFYHSNGFSQYNAQRYALDWLPAVLIAMAPALTVHRLEWFRLMVAWGIVLNVATVAVLALTKAG